MDFEHLIGSLITGAVTGKSSKRGWNAARFATRKGGLLNASTLITLAGVAWGLYETVQQKGAPGSAAPGTPTGNVPFPYPIPGSGGAVTSTGWPSPDAAGSAPSQAPPLPGAGVERADAAIPPEALRLIRLTVSAARADGSLSPEEEETILARAREEGVEAIVRQEITSPRPLAEIVAGVDEPSQKEEIYTLAFTIVRADEGVTGAERIYLAQLAHLLRLDPSTVARLEEETAARIDAQA